MQFRGDRLKDLRQQRKLRTRGREGSQSWTARAISAHVTSLSDWERGENEPSGRHVASLAALFGVDAKHFYSDEDDEEAAATMAHLGEAQFLEALRPFARLLSKVGD